MEKMFINSAAVGVFKKCQLIVLCRVYINCICKKEGVNLEFKHKPVLLNECITGLNINKNGIYVDGTLGGAGHSKVILENLSEKGLLIGIDRDLEALEAAKLNLQQYENVKYIHGNHDDIKNILNGIGIQKVDGILLDLGVSSYQLDEKTRGFSYIGTNKLDMRMDKTQEFSAYDVVNTYTEERLANILFEYGEEKFAKNIARDICKYRLITPIETTSDLVKIIENSIPKSKQKDGHPAKRTFQAIRIEVNNELQPLKNTVKDCIESLNENGRLCIITFHSLEDRAVKEAFNEAVGQCTCPKDLPYCVCNYKSFGKLINKKPITATKEELEQNTRSQSAKLRIFEKI